VQAAHLIRRKDEPVLPTGAGDVETSLRDPLSADRGFDLHQGWGTRRRISDPDPSDRGSRVVAPEGFCFKCDCTACIGGGRWLTWTIGAIRRMR
jgi:hypothetical protein